MLLASLATATQANKCGRSDVPCLEVPPCSSGSGGGSGGGGGFVAASSFLLDTNKSAACHGGVSALCNDATLNGACLARLRQAYGARALPLVAARDVACDAGGNSPAVPACHGREWRCYSPLSLRPGDGRWSNASSAVPLAVCSGEGAVGDALRAAWRACPAPPPRQGTRARLCHEPGRGLRVTANATDADIFSNARHCNDPTFALGDVVELFVAPVSSAWDNPAWYMEIDAASNGVLWGGLSYNPLGYKAPHQGGNFTGNETCARYEAAHPGACVNACNASTLDACALSCSGAASFYGGLTVRASTDGDSWWAADFWVPWAILPQLHSGASPLGTPPPPPRLLRLNLYRYDYPTRRANGTWDRKDFELTAWSPSGYGDFHTPSFFGVAVLLDK
jgi:hypothetical protein